MQLSAPADEEKFEQLMTPKPKPESPRRPPYSEETTLDLSSLILRARQGGAGAGDQDGEEAAEADVILIAHPDEKPLGTRYSVRPMNTMEIGRSTDVEISLPDVRSISRRHARLIHRGKRVEIEDLSSTNGTYVNDLPVEGCQVLRSGDRFQVGAVHFKFLHERDPEHAYHEAIHQLVVCDGLTQAFNQRKLKEELRREFDRARRHQRPLCLVLFDIDHFKQVNDTFGHLCGDFVLQQISRLVRRRLSAEQIFARVGGEEFAVLAPEMELATAIDLAEDLRLAIAEETFSYSGAELSVTCSFGVHAYSSEFVGPSELYEAADRELYRSKRSGRDRVSAGADPA